VSRQRERHLHRQPTEEAIRQAVSEFVGRAGTVEVQRMSYEWRADDVLVQVLLKVALTDSTLSNFRAALSRIVRSTVPVGDPLEDWLVVIECGGEVLARVAPYDSFDKQHEERGQ
jgi:hypothetical protein